MKRLLLLLLISLLALGASARAGHQQHSRGKQGLAAGRTEVPAKAVDVYRYVLAHGRAPEGYVGGRKWHNRERRLPLDGSYREFDVNPKVRGVNRGAERIIVDTRARKGWYTADHYRTFVPIPDQHRQ